MSLLRRALAARVPANEERGYNIDSIASMLRANYDTPSGVSVDGESAMRHDAVWSCVTKIAQDVSMMPVDVVRYANGKRHVVSPVPQIIAAPSSVVSALDWRYQVIESLLLDGNAWGRVTSTSPDGAYPTRIELLPFSDVVPVKEPGSPRVRVDGGEPQELWPIGQIWHLPAYTLPGSWLGLSPISYHRNKIGAGLAAGQFGEEFFGAGGHPSSILAPESDPGPEGAKRIKQAFIDATRGREPAVLPQSIKYTQVQINPSDSQFIEAMRYSVEQVCRIFNEDPADHGASVGSGGSITYANRSDTDLARFKRRQFWVVKLQEALSACLPRPQVVRLNTSAALMMTPRERHELHALRLASRTLTVNEVRVIEDEEPFGDEYDEPGIPDAGSGDSSDAPDSPDSPDMEGAA